MTQVVIILAVAALAVAFGLLQRRRDQGGAPSHGCGACHTEPAPNDTAPTDAAPSDPAACRGCTLECDHPETSHVRSA